MHKEYLTDEARKSAINEINNCIDALMNEPGLPSKLGINLDHTIDYLARYREVVAREQNTERLNSRTLIGF